MSVQCLFAWPPSPSKGLLGLSPELVLEIVSHLGPGKELRPTRSGVKLQAWPMVRLATDTRKSNLANLRLVCRYLSEVLEYDIFKSITFDFNGTRAPEAQVESQLVSLSNGGCAASRYATLLTIQSLRPSRRLYNTDDEKADAKARSLTRIISAHLEGAILSFQNLRSLAWNVEQVDDHSALVMNALSSLPSLEDLALRIDAMVDSPAALSINRLSGLRSLEISLINHPRYYGSSGDSPDDFVDHLCELISKSPRLCHLSVIQPVRHKYDVSFRQLVRKVPADQPLAHLESLHLAIPDLKLDATTVVHLKSLTTLRVEGSAHALFTGEELWPVLSGAGIKLLDITVSHLSEPLSRYLLSYSGLQRLHVMLTYYPHGDWTTYDRQRFMREVLPLHNLSSMINSARWDSDSSTGPSQGLTFEVQPNRKTMSDQSVDTVPTWDVTVCMDSIPDCLPLVLDSLTQSETCRVERLTIKLSSTMMYFGCGTGKLAYMSRQSGSGTKWIEELEITEPKRYPSQVAINAAHPLHLMPNEDVPYLYVYQRRDD